MRVSASDTALRVTTSHMCSGTMKAAEMRAFHMYSSSGVHPVLPATAQSNVCNRSSDKERLTASSVCTVPSSVCLTR